MSLDRERNRVLVAEALQRAAMIANNGNLEAACLLLAETESMLVSSPSTLAREPLSEGGAERGADCQGPDRTALHELRVAGRITHPDWEEQRRCH